MSLPFSDTTTLKGAVQIFEAETGQNPGDVSGNTTKLKQFCADYNLALDDFFNIGFETAGTFQLDDTNHTKIAPIFTNLVSGQRNYTFTVDENSNLILEFYKLFILPSATATVYQEIYPVDKESDLGKESFWANTGTTGIPSEYDKNGNTIALNVPPSYSVSSGIGAYVSREPFYMTYTDDTRKPGVPGTLQRYFPIKAAYNYARRNNLANLANLEKEVIYFEGSERLHVIGEIQKYFGRRTKDEQKVLSSVITNFQ
jgi:hypothetical protein